MKNTISLFWSNFYKTLSYTEEHFRDKAQLATWENIGHNIDNTTIGISPIKDEAHIIDIVSKHFSHLSHIGVCFHRLSPGNYLPPHQDKYGYYSKMHNVLDLNLIKRYVIFAEDWEQGHLLTIDDTVYSNWKAGDIVGWSGTTLHSAINVGNKNRYTIQVTGVINA
tara:strand:+ start:14875 stop:15372 length:498 start_codon:yes stop_codon:yes gene_type:complete